MARREVTTKSRSILLAFELNEGALKRLDAILSDVLKANESRYEKELANSLNLRRQSSLRTARKDLAGEKLAKREKEIEKHYDEWLDEDFSRFKEESSFVRYELLCSDESTIQTQKLETIIDFPNIKSRRIVELRAQIYSSGNGTSVSIWLSNEGYQWSVKYSIDGQDKEVLHLSNSLDEFLSGIRVWYNGLRVLSALYYFSCIFLITFGTVAFISINGKYSIFEIFQKTPAEKFELVYAYLFVTFIVSIALSGLWAVVRNKVFPIAVFCFGAGISRKKKIDFIHYLLGITIGVGLIIGWITK